MLKKPFSPRLLKKVQMSRDFAGRRAGYPSAGWVQVRGVLGPYAAAPRERAGYPSAGWVTADGPFSAAC